MVLLVYISRIIFNASVQRSAGLRYFVSFELTYIFDYKAIIPNVQIHNTHYYIKHNTHGSGYTQGTTEYIHTSL